jgi:hypothetical protein
MTDEELEELKAKLKEICEGIKSGKYKTRTIKAELESAQGLPKVPPWDPPDGDLILRIFDFKTNDDLE